MTDTSPTFGPLHPVTRLARVRQQVQAFTELHAAELDNLAAELATAGATALADRLRTYRGLHAQEAALLLDELDDLRATMVAQASSAPTDDHPTATLPPGATGVPAGGGRVAHISTPAEGAPPRAAASGSDDPAAHSPRRARWLASQPGRLSRRAFFTRFPRRSQPPS